MTTTNDNRPKKFIKIVSLDDAVETAKKAVKRVTKPTSKVKLEKKVSKIQYNRVNGVSFEDLNFKEPEWTPNCIKEFLRGCHKDLNKFIDQNEWTKIIANADGLRITTKNRFNIAITNISRNTKSVLIRDHKKKVIFKGLQNTYFNN
jgi:hypothetical protein